MLSLLESPVSFPPQRRPSYQYCQKRFTQLVQTKGKNQRGLAYCRVRHASHIHTHPLYRTSNTGKWTRYARTTEHHRHIKSHNPHHTHNTHKFNTKRLLIVPIITSYPKKKATTTKRRRATSINRTKSTAAQQQSTNFKNHPPFKNSKKQTKAKIGRSSWSS